MNYILRHIKLQDSRKENAIYLIPYVTISYVTIPYVTIPYVTIPYVTIPYVTIPYVTIPYVTIPYVTIPYVTIPYVTLFQPLKRLGRIVIQLNSLNFKIIHKFVILILVIYNMF